MMRRMRNLIGSGIRQPNIQAAGVAFLTLAAVNLSTDPLPAGSEPLSVTETDSQPSQPTPAPRLIAAMTTQSPMRDGLEPHALLQQATGTTNTIDNLLQGKVTPVANQNQNSDVLTGKWAIQMNVLMLQQGMEKFTRVSDYMATFTKQERIGGDLSKMQKIALKVRHEPFSVYMKWRSGETGQQVLFVEGQNEGKMLVKAGGFKARLGTLALEPTSTLAMSQSRHPVSMVGLTKAAEQILKYQEKALTLNKGYQCELRSDAEFDGRPCFSFNIVYEAPEHCPDYRKSEILIDKQLSLPVSVRNFTWSKDAAPETIDEETLIEHYTYSEIQTQQQLADADFDRSNEAYRMVR